MTFHVRPRNTFDCTHTITQRMLWYPLILSCAHTILSHLIYMSPLCARTSRQTHRCIYTLRLFGRQIRRAKKMFYVLYARRLLGASTVKERVRQKTHRLAMLMVELPKHITLSKGALWCTRCLNIWICMANILVHMFSNFRVKDYLCAGFYYGFTEICLWYVIYATKWKKYVLDILHTLEYF